VILPLAKQEIRLRVCRIAPGKALLILASIAIVVAVGGAAAAAGMALWGYFGP
jgi:hypothetical protein